MELDDVTIIESAFLREMRWAGGAYRERLQEEKAAFDRIVVRLQDAERELDAARRVMSGQWQVGKGDS